MLVSVPDKPKLCVPEIVSVPALVTVPATTVGVPLQDAAGEVQGRAARAGSGEGGTELDSGATIRRRPSRSPRKFPRSCRSS